MIIGILGAGTWGISLARMLSNSGHDVQVWSAISADIDQLTATRKQKNLPYMVIPDNGQTGKSLYQGWPGGCRCCQRY